MDRRRTGCAGSAGAACWSSTSCSSASCERHPERRSGRCRASCSTLPDNDLLGPRERAQRAGCDARHRRAWWSGLRACSVNQEDNAMDKNGNTDASATASRSTSRCTSGHDRARRDRHPHALRQDRHVHLRPGLPVDGELPLDDHLHRRRRGRAAVPRLSDRAARGALRLPRGLLPAAERRAAEQGAEGRVRRHRHAPHDGARAAGALLHGLPPRRAPDGGDGAAWSARCRPSITTRSTSTTRSTARSRRSA